MAKVKIRKGIRVKPRKQEEYALYGEGVVVESTGPQEWMVHFEKRSAVATFRSRQLKVLHSPAPPPASAPSADGQSDHGVEEKEEVNEIIVDPLLQQRGQSSGTFNDIASSSDEEAPPPLPQQQAHPLSHDTVGS